MSLNSPPLDYILTISRRVGGNIPRRWLRFAFLLSLAALFLDITFTIAFQAKETRIRPIPAAYPDAHAAQKQRIYIASLHWNDENLIREHWGPALLETVKHYGPENIFVSILEGGSWDGTKEALKELDTELEGLGVERWIELLDRTHKDEVDRVPGVNETGWIPTGRIVNGEKRLRRIPFLAGERNKAMEKLRELQNRDEGKRREFDKVLWLNDVIFTADDVTTLLATRSGDYSAVCALDFSVPHLYYDVFALRDINGHKTTTLTWPYFLASASRKAIISSSPVPVKSCWNGMIAFQAESFYNDNPKVEFRGIPDSLATQHLEGSECCLIHADIAAISKKNSKSRRRGVWLNPNVRVAYNAETHVAVHPQKDIWPGRLERFKGIWWNRWMRWMGWPSRWSEQRVIDEGIQSWRQWEEGQNTEAGRMCLVNEMQILVENGWIHV